MSEKILFLGTDGTVETRTLPDLHGSLYGAIGAERIEHVPLDGGLALIADEQGRLTGRAWNAAASKLIGGFGVVGDALVAGVSGAAYRSLTESEAAQVRLRVEPA